MLELKEGFLELYDENRDGRIEIREVKTLGTLATLVTLVL